jgi:hypothetical protein
MRSHQIAKILLENPDVPLVVMTPSDDPYAYFIEATSVTFTNCGQFIDSNGFTGEEYNSARKCVEIK